MKTRIEYEYETSTRFKNLKPGELFITKEDWDDDNTRAKIYIKRDDETKCLPEALGSVYEHFQASSKVIVVEPKDEIVFVIKG